MSKIQATPPEEKSGPRLREAKTTAGGPAAVLSSLQHIVQETGLLKGTQALASLNQKDGVDCPGCAWPDPDEHRSMAEFCENGAKAIAEEITDARVGAEFFAKHSLAELSTWSDYNLGKSGRLTEPLYLQEGSSSYKPISWDAAFDLLATKLKNLADPNEAVFYTSGRTSNETAFLYQLLVRLFGTNNLPDCSNMCHESSGRALTETIGIGKGTVTLDDFNHADCIFVIGQNPGTNHPRMLTALEKARANGAEIVTINPLKEAGCQEFQNPQLVKGWLSAPSGLSTQYLQVKIGRDIALLKGILKHILEMGKIDKEFIEAKTLGFEQMQDDLKSLSWQTITDECGLTEIEIKKAAITAANSKAMIWCWAMGMTQHKDSVGAIAQIVNILLLGGHFGRKGAGVCPVRGHSNVQGDRTMGIWERPSKAFLESLEKTFAFKPPVEHGYDVVEAIAAMNQKKVKVFMCMGGNFLSATPDTLVTAKGLQEVDLTVQVSTKLNRSHLITGKEALIFPCLGRTEIDRSGGKKQFVTVENSMGVVHASRGNLEPASPNLKSETQIVCELGSRLFAETEVLNWSAWMCDYALVRGLIAKTLPGFADYNQRVEKPGGFYLPNKIREKAEFLTSDQKAKFTTYEIPQYDMRADEFMMMTIRTHDQYNTTIYGLDDRYRGIHGGRRVILMNAKDMREKGLKELDIVNLSSCFAGKTREAKSFYVVPYDIPQRCAATYFPEANVLIPLESTAIKSNTPTSKSVIIKIEKN